MILKAPFITLSQLLKIEGFIESGGQAKFFLQQEKVFVNGQLETRRGRKLVSGDTVEVMGSTILLEDEI